MHIVIETRDIPPRDDFTVSEGKALREELRGVGVPQPAKNFRPRGVRAMAGGGDDGGEDNRSREKRPARGDGEGVRMARRPDEIPESSFHANKISPLRVQWIRARARGKRPVFRKRHRERKRERERETYKGKRRRFATKPNTTSPSRRDAFVGALTRYLVGRAIPRGAQGWEKVTGGGRLSALAFSPAGGREGGGLKSPRGPGCNARLIRRSGSATDKEPPRSSEQSSGGGGDGGRGIESDETCVWIIAIFRMRLAAAFVIRERSLSEVHAARCPTLSPPPPLIHRGFIAKLHESSLTNADCRRCIGDRIPFRAAARIVALNGNCRHARIGLWRFRPSAAGPFARSISEGTVPARKAEK